MAKNVFISFRFHDGKDYKEKLVEELEKHDRIIDFSEDEDRSEYSEESIRKYLYGKIRRTSVTIILITKEAINHKKTGDKYDDWMYDEIRYSLEDREENRTSGLVAVYTKDAKDFLIEESKHTCDVCKTTKRCTTIKQVDNLFRKNMFNVKEEYKYNRCNNLYDSNYDHYCTLLSWEEFMDDIEKYIDIAYDKKENVNNYMLVVDLNKSKVGS